jgi:DMSO reductase anchor subunit
MHPEMSLVLLTVLAGAGQGIFILLVTLDVLANGALSSGFIYTAGAVSLLLQAAGIVASTSHLGNPHRGWRAILMVANSWLSREVVTLSASVGAVIVYMLAYHFSLPEGLRIVAGLVGAAASIGFYISSSMVYASVKFIKEWANAYTPINFTLFGITSGLGAGLAILYYIQPDHALIQTINYIVIFLTLISLLTKALAYKFNANAYVSVNIKNAVGVNNPDIKLIDMGTSYAHYNTKEFYHPSSESNDRQMKSIVLNAAFILPLIIWIAAANNVFGDLNSIFGIIAAVIMIGGLILERRVFFTQGNNIQNLYYSNFRSTGARNPMLRKADKCAPVPMD